MAIVKCQTISGETIEIEEAGLLPRPCAYALILNDNNEILIENPKEEGGKYWFIGGGLEKNENPEVALIREAKEEAGVNIEVMEKLTTLEYCYYHNKLNKYFRCYSDFYICKYVSQTEMLVAPEVKTIWLKISELNDEDFHLLIRQALGILRSKVRLK